MRAHSPQLAAGLASEIKIDLIPYWEDSLQLAAGYASMPIPPIGVAAYVFVYNLFSKYHGQLPGSLAETLSEILIATVLSTCAYFAFIVLIIVFVKLTKAL